MNFFDTSVLVAASVPEHPQHPESLALLLRLRDLDGACAAHTLAETYNTLTSTRRGYGWPSFAAARVVEQTNKIFTLVSLTTAEMIRVMQTASEQNIAGPIIYDALILSCARKVKANKIYTHNLKHFRQVAPDLAAFITTP